MSTQPYNELGQILAEGGEIVLARAIWIGASAADIYRLFQRRFEPLTDSDRAALWDHADRMVAAGRYVDGLDDEDEIDIDNLPTNSFLGGEEQEGASEYFQGRFRCGPDGQWYDVSLWEGRVGSKSEVTSAIRDYAGEIISKYPGRFDGCTEGEEELLEIEIGISEKKY